MVKKFLSVPLLALASLMAPSPSGASVIYDFSGEVFGDSFGFVYTAPDFIVPPLILPAAVLDSCDAHLDPSCATIGFSLTS